MLLWLRLDLFIDRLVCSLPIPALTNVAPKVATYTTPVGRPFMVDKANPADVAPKVATHITSVISGYTLSTCISLWISW